MTEHKNDFEKYVIEPVPQDSVIEGLMIHWDTKILI